MVRAFIASDGNARFKSGGGGGGGGGGSVEFPCGLVASGFQLAAGMTLYFLVAPLAFEPGDQAAGQRFFGHYPFGQLRFRDGRVALRSDSAEYVLRLPAGGGVVAGAWNLVAYRVLVDGPPEASLGGAPFAAMTPLALGRGEGRPVAFSDTATVTLGGTNSDCSFAGEVSEVLVFGDVLGDDDAALVAGYLTRRHGLTLPPMAMATNEPPSPDTPVLAMGAGLQPRPASSGVSGGVSTSVASESLALLAQMEVLKAQLDRLMASAAAPPGAPLSATSAARVISPLRRAPDSAQQQPAWPEPPMPDTPRPRAEARSEARSEARGSAALSAPYSRSADAGRHQAAPLQAPPLTRKQQRLQGAPAASSGKAASGGGAGKCAGGDAFGGVSVEGWTAPPSAELEVLQQWEDSYKSTFAEISHFDHGGKSLRDFIHTQVNALKVLRHKLFCRYA
jgi:hypothetical protein